MSLNKIILFCVVCASILSGCSSTEEKKEGLLNGADADASTSGYSDGSLLGGEEFGNNANVDALGLGAEFRDPNNPLSKGIIYFRYDSSQIKPEFVQVVAAHSEYLKNHPSRNVILEGHADERGSREYNIALGEQRAKSIARMMKMQGVNSRQLEIVSYGEEKPDSDGMDETSWELNRRVEVVYQGK